MDQSCSKFSESFGLDRYWSIECSSLSAPIFSPEVPKPFLLHFLWQNLPQTQTQRRRIQQPILGLSVPWSLRPQNRAAAATCGRGRCELPAISLLRPAKRKTLRFLQRNGCEPACGHRGHCDFCAAKLNVLGPLIVFCFHSF